MKVNVTFSRLDPKYRQEYADEYEFGEESSSNSKVISQMSFQTDKVKKYSIKKNQVYHLRGFKGENEFDIPIGKMTILNCILEDGTETQYAISDELMEKAPSNSKSLKRNTANISFYLNDKKKIRPIPGVYISVNDLPNEFINPIQKEED